MCANIIYKRPSTLWHAARWILAGRRRRRRRDSLDNMHSHCWRKSVVVAVLACCFLYGLVSCWFIYLLKTEYSLFFFLLVRSNVHFIWHRLCAQFRRVFFFPFFHLFHLFFRFFFFIRFVFFSLLPLCPCARAYFFFPRSYASLLVRNFVSSSYLPTTLKAH